MASRSTKISDAEWEVMEILWEEAPLPSSEIIRRLEPDTDWSPKTIHTLISRLVKKKVLEVEKETNRYLYHPLISREECRIKETESFVQKVYQGSASLLVANFIKENKLSPAEIEELKKLLEEGERTGGK